MTLPPIGPLLHDFWERPLPALTPRDIRLIGRREKADVLIGMRRAGKTYRLYQEISELLEAGVAKRHMMYLNFEDDRLGGLPLQADLLSDAVETFYRLSPEARSDTAYMFLDEIQRVSGWSRVARRLLDTERIRLCVTGSSSKLLSTEVSTEFRGRGFASEVLPYSFLEAVRHAGMELPTEMPGARVRSHLEARFDRYLDVGGFPEVQTYEEQDRIQTLQDYVELVLLRDIVERHHITNVHAVRALAHGAISSTGSLFSVHKVYRDLTSRGIDVGKSTLYALMDHFADAFLLFTVPVFRRSLRARQTTPKKVYAVDPGLARALSHIADENLGARLETAVYLELRRRSRDRRSGHLSYYRTSAGHEIDFVLGDDGGRRVAALIQVCADLSNADTRRRELRALDEAMHETGTSSAQVITLREFGTEETPTGKVTLVPAWQWFLDL